MTTDDRYVVHPRGVGQSTEYLGHVGVAADHGVHDGRRDSAHRGDIVDVGKHSGDAGAVRVLLNEGRRDRLATDDGARSVELDHGAVVTGAVQRVAGADEVAHLGDRTLPGHARVPADDRHHLVHEWCRLDAGRGWTGHGPYPIVDARIGREISAPAAVPRKAS